jgi:hypothetical protein
LWRLLFLGHCLKVSLSSRERYPYCSCGARRACESSPHRRQTTLRKILRARSRRHSNSASGRICSDEIRKLIAITGTSCRGAIGRHCEEQRDAAILFFARNGIAMGHHGERRRSNLKVSLTTRRDGFRLRRRMRLLIIFQCFFCKGS